MSEALALCSFPVPSAAVHWEITRYIKLGNGVSELVQNKAKLMKKNEFLVLQNVPEGVGEREEVAEAEREGKGVESGEKRVWE